MRPGEVADRLRQAIRDSAHCPIPSLQGDAHVRAHYQASYLVTYLKQLADNLDDLDEEEQREEQIRDDDEQEWLAHQP